jgi:mannosyltransferase OCH1-like enzyme
MDDTLICIILSLVVGIAFLIINHPILQRFLAILLILLLNHMDVRAGFIGVLFCIAYFVLLPKAENMTSVEDESVANESILPESTIPKIIIQTWKTRDPPAKYTSLVKSLKSLNPSFEYKFFSDEDIETFLKEFYPDYYITYLKLPIKIQKIDFFRYVAIYHYGGFYFDLDMLGLASLDDPLLLNSECVFPVDEMIYRHMCNQERYKEFCKNNMYFLLGQYAFGAQPKNEFIKALIDGIHLNINFYLEKYGLTYNKEIYVYQTTGPDYVSKVYLDYVKKSSVRVLHYSQRQYFGKYAQHRYFGSWKS